VPGSREQKDRERYNGMRKVHLLFLVVFLFIVLNSMLFQVDEKQLAVVVQFGKPVQIIEDAGLHVKWPAPIQNCIFMDKRLLYFDPRPSEYLTSDKKNIVVGSYICWTITDPLKFLKTVRDRMGAEIRIGDIVASHLGASFGNYPLTALISINEGEVQLDEIMDHVTSDCNQIGEREFGLSIRDVRIKRLNFPEQNKNSVFERMRAERMRIAKKYRSEGEEEATKIRAEADRKKREILSKAYMEAQELEGEGDAGAMKIYADAFQKDPGFYKLVRTLNSYEKFLNEKTTVILSSDSQLMELLTKGVTR
jgi:membrane protease subunit HflC